MRMHISEERGTSETGEKARQRERQEPRAKDGPALRRHVKELQQARQTYGPVRLGNV